MKGDLKRGYDKYVAWCLQVLYVRPASFQVWLQMRDYLRENERIALLDDSRFGFTVDQDEDRGEDQDDRADELTEIPENDLRLALA